MLKNFKDFQNLSGPIFIITAAVLWALDGVIRRHLFTLPPITIIFLEHLIGFVILFPFVYKKLFPTLFTKREWILVFVISVLSGLLGTLWFTTALLKVNFISFSVVFLLQKLQPIFAITTARIFLKERFEASYVKWAVLALVAAYFVTFKNGVVNLETGEGTVIAALYALGAAFAWGSSTTFSKMLLGKVSYTVSTFYRFLFTIIVALPVLFFSGKISSLDAVTESQWGWLGLIAVSTGMVALLIYYKGLSRTPVHISTILELTFPFIAILIDMKFYNSHLSLTQWIAALVLVFSIYKIARLQNSVSNEKVSAAAL